MWLALRPVGCPAQPDAGQSRSVTRPELARPEAGPGHGGGSTGRWDHCTASCNALSAHTCALQRSGRDPQDKPGREDLPGSAGRLGVAWRGSEQEGVVRTRQAGRRAKAQATIASPAASPVLHIPLVSSAIFGVASASVRNRESRWRRHGWRGFKRMRLGHGRRSCEMAGLT